MAKIITYNNPLTGNPNQCFCQMKFDDGLRILISQSREGIKIYKLIIGSIPSQILYKANFSEMEKHKKFMNVDVDSQILLDSYVATIKPMSNSKDFYDFVKST